MQLILLQKDKLGEHRHVIDDRLMSLKISVFVIHVSKEHYRKLNKNQVGWNFTSKKLFYGIFLNIYRNMCFPNCFLKDQSEFGYIEKI